MGSLAVIDWTIVAAYLVATLLVGAWVSRSAGRSLDSYFVADRSLPEKSFACMCATCVFESALHAPIRCGCLRA